MNFPAVVKQSFEELRHQPEYMAIVNALVDALKRLGDPVERARLVHQIVDDYNVTVFDHPLVMQLMPCTLGCTACCYTQVSVTEDEARLLTLRIKEGVDVDKDRLRIQMKAGNDDQAFFNLSYENRKCIFLNNEGACKVYEDRPSVCRTNAVLGRSDQCDTSESVQPTRLVKTSNADMAIYAAYLSSREAGTLPYLVGELLGLSPEEE